MQLSSCLARHHYFPVDKVIVRVEMASQYSEHDGQNQEIGSSSDKKERQLEPNQCHTCSQFGPGHVQTDTEDSFALQWLENYRYADSNKDYSIKYVEDESFRNFVKSLLDTVTGANNGPVTY